MTASALTTVLRYFEENHLHINSLCRGLFSLDPG